MQRNQKPRPQPKQSKKKATNKAVKKLVRKEVNRDLAVARRGPANTPYNSMQQHPGGRMVGRNNPNVAATNLVAQVATSKEIWETDLLMHLANPMMTYHLPGIDTTGVTFSPTYNPSGPSPGGRDTNGSSGASPTNMRTINVTETATYPIRQGESDRQMESNQFRFDGWVLNRMPLDVSAGEWNMFVVFNPLEPSYPIMALNWEEGSNPWGTATDGLPWTASPFIVKSLFAGISGAESWPEDVTVGFNKLAGQRNKAERDSSSDRWTSVSSDRGRPTVRDERVKDAPAPLAPIPTYDMLNYYYIGGAEMTAKIVGANAFTAFSCLARDDAHTVTRFWTVEDDPTDTSTFDWGATVQFAPGHNVGYAAYTGTKWGLAMSNTSPESAEWRIDRIRWALSQGYPAIHFKYSVPAGSSTVPYLQVTANTWLGVAPTTLRFAGAAPHRTIPLSMPSWASYCRARGSTARDENAARAGAANSTFGRLASAPSESRVVNAVARNPQQATKTLSTAAKVGKTAANVATEILSAFVPAPAKVALGLGRYVMNSVLDRPATAPVDTPRITGRPTPYVEEA